MYYKKDTREKQRKLKSYLPMITIDYKVLVNHYTELYTRFYLLGRQPNAADYGPYTLRPDSDYTTLSKTWGDQSNQELYRYYATICCVAYAHRKTNLPRHLP